MSTEPIWSRPAPGTRKPAHTREAIVARALEIADTEGFDAVSMRRIAADLGAGTMTLYHYVRTKDDLIALMADAIMGELLVPDDELPAHWRDGLAELARRTREIFARHPWVLEHIDEGDGVAGPNTLRHVEQSLAIAAGTGLPQVDQFEIIALVDDYAFGYVMRVSAREPFGDPESSQPVLEYLQAQLATGEFPHLAQFAGDDIGAAFARLDEGPRFETGLAILLDGIEVEVARRLAG